ncbi:MAG TPA: hypothetical protein VFG25_00580 [Nitrosopumilaceae archaeon]|nr:hypothetical protein [Nitrosopumilaceae archaeon]
MSKWINFFFHTKLLDWIQHPEPFMVTFNDYLKGILKQILESYRTLLELKDKPGDLEIIKTEILKINGFFKIIIRKIESSQNQSDTLMKLLKKSKHFLSNYEFEREIETMSILYSNDSDRLRNIRLKIIESLQDKKLMENIETIYDEMS